MAQKLVSSWYNLHSAVPSSYVQPPETRPDNAVFASGKLVPVIDLEGHDRPDIIRNILKSSQDYGFFQVHIFFIHQYPSLHCLLSSHVFAMYEIMDIGCTHVALELESPISCKMYIPIRNYMSCMYLWCCVI